MSAWPSIACTARRSAPRSSRWVAKRVAQLVGRDGLADPRAAARSGASSFQKPWRVIGRPAPGDEERVATAPASRPAAGLGEVLAQPRPRLLAERHQPLLAPLAEGRQVAGLEVHVAQPAGRPAPRRAGRWRRASRASPRRAGRAASWRRARRAAARPPPDRGRRAACGRAGSVQVLGGIAFGELLGCEEAVKTAHGRQVPRVAAGDSPAFPRRTRCESTSSSVTSDGSSLRPAPGPRSTP